MVKFVVSHHGGFKNNDQTAVKNRPPHRFLTVRKFLSVRKYDTFLTVRKYEPVGKG